MSSITSDCVIRFTNLKYDNHVLNLQLFAGTIRDIADTLILVKQEAEEDPEETDVDKLTDAYIAPILLDILFGKVSVTSIKTT